MNIKSIPGCVGCLPEEAKPITQANIRPYVIALLMHKHEISLSDVVTTIQPHCPSSDYKIGFNVSIDDTSDYTRLEKLILEVLEEFLMAKILRYNNSKSTWSLTAQPGAVNLPIYINWVSATGGQLSQDTLELFQDNAYFD